MEAQIFRVIHDSQFQDVPLNNASPHRKMAKHTILNITDENDRQSKTKWYDHENKIVTLAIILLLAIVFFSLAGINLYLSNEAAAETRPSPITRYSTTLPSLPTTTIQYIVTAERDAFPKSFFPVDEETIQTEGPTTENYSY